MPIPENISREHVLKALKEIDINGVPQRHEARNTFLIYAGKRYPPKYVISIANKYANGEPLGGFTTNEAVRYLKNLGFEIEKIPTVTASTDNRRQESTLQPIITPRKYPPDEFDRRMYLIFKGFSMLVEERLKAIIEGRSELKAIWQESEDTIRYMMFYALATIGDVSPLDIYLEYPHPEVPNRNYAKLDTFVTSDKDKPAIAFEMKFHKKNQ